jgi:curved DNA-binding protein CbpA
LSKRYHPDTSPLPPEDAIRCFHEIQEAYRVLSNPSQRGLYDSTLWLQDPQAWRRDYHRDPQPTPEDVALGKPALQWEMQTRPLSGAELFALLSMGLVFVACLLLVGGIAWLRESNVG